MIASVSIVQASSRSKYPIRDLKDSIRVLNSNLKLLRDDISALEAEQTKLFSKTDTLTEKIKKGSPLSTNLSNNVARLEGSVITMQRLISLYASLIIVVILFLTWRQQNVAKLTAIEEINSSFKFYKERIEEIEKQARSKLAEIELHHKLMSDYKINMLNTVKEAVNKANDDLRNLNE